MAFTKKEMEEMFKWASNQPEISDKDRRKIKEYCNNIHTKNDNSMKELNNEEMENLKQYINNFKKQKRNIS